MTTAITGRYKAPNKGIDGWVMDWIYRSQYWSSPRIRLTEELKYIKRAHGRKASQEYRDYLLWVGIYPVKRLKSTLENNQIKTEQFWKNV